MNTQPQLTGALSGLKILQPADLPQFKAALSAGQQQGFGYYFPYLLSYQRADRSAILYEYTAGSICVYRWRNKAQTQRLDLQLAPAPMQADAVQHCLQRANDFNTDYSAKILKIDAKDAPSIQRMDGLKLRPRKSQYLYAPSHFSDISSRPFRTLRRNIARARQHPLEIRPYQHTDLAGCQALLDKWQRYHRAHFDSRGGVATSRRILHQTSNFNAPDLIGEVIEIEGRIVAFSFGGEIRPGAAAFLEAKSDFEITGLSYLQRYSFMSKLTAYDTINDGPDVGRSGLARLKNSLRPCAWHEEFQARQTRATSRGTG